MTIDDKISSCPYCNYTCKILKVPYGNTKNAVYCFNKSEICQYTGPSKGSSQEAIQAHNKICKILKDTLNDN